MSHRDPKEVFKTIMSFVLILLLVVFVLAGCTTPPVIPKFPEAPTKAGAMESCPDLTKLKDGAKLSDVSKTITLNYSTYYECAVKSDIWIEWYQINKENYDKIGK
jgi:hypothetical protein